MAQVSRRTRYVSTRPDPRTNLTPSMLSLNSRWAFSTCSCLALCLLVGRPLPVSITWNASDRNGCPTPTVYQRTVSWGVLPMTIRSSIEFPIRTAPLTQSTVRVQTRYRELHPRNLLHPGPLLCHYWPLRRSYVRSLMEFCRVIHFLYIIFIIKGSVNKYVI